MLSTEGAQFSYLCITNSKRLHISCISNLNIYGSSVYVIVVLRSNCVAFCDYCLYFFQRVFVVRVLAALYTQVTDMYSHGEGYANFFGALNGVESKDVCLIARVNLVGQKQFAAIRKN